MSKNTTAVEQSMIDGDIYERNPSLDSHKVKEKLTTARIALLIRQPFFGNLLHVYKLKMLQNGVLLPQLTAVSFTTMKTLLTH